MESIRDDEIALLWYPKAPADADKYRNAIRGGLGGPLFAAFDRHGASWRVTQAHSKGDDDRRDDVRRVLLAVGLAVE